MRNRQILHIINFLYCDLEVGVENREFWAASQELYEFVQLLLVVTLQYFP